MELSVKVLQRKFLKYSLSLPLCQFKRFVKKRISIHSILYCSNCIAHIRCNLLQVVEKNKLLLISDPSIIEEMCSSVIKEKAHLLKKHSSGKKDLTRVLESAVWNKSEGRANMTLVKEWFKTNYPFSKQ